MRKGLFAEGGRITILSGAFLLTSCHLSYQLAGVEGGRVAMSSAYDKHPDEEVLAMLLPYKLKVDSVMTPVIGKSERSMKAGRPESLLSNLVADVLRKSVSDYQDGFADVAVVNVGGLRNDLSEGDIMYGSIYEILPFENSLCILTMNGKSLVRLFGEIAKAGGEGLSGARLKITTDGNLVDATIGGEKVDESKLYKVATLDYLSEGNDGLKAFIQAEDKTCPEGVMIRQIFIDYVTTLTREGKAVNSYLDGRIVIVK